MAVTKVPILKEVTSFKIGTLIELDDSLLASSHDKSSSAFSSDGVIAIGASMQHIFPVILAERNVKAADAA